MKKAYIFKAIAVLLMFTLLISLAACDPGKTDDNFIESIPEINGGSEDPSGTHENSDPEPAAGQAHIPVIVDTINITPRTILVSGTCDEGTSVAIRGGDKDVTVESINGYFVAQVALSETNKSFSILEATAFSDKLTESEIRSFQVDYNATAEKRVDGYAVSVGSNSNLVFDYAIDDYSGTNLISQTTIASFKAFVNVKVTNFTSRSDGNPVEIIYVLIPDATTVYPERLPEGTEKSSFKTRLEYVSEAISKTNATLLDMTEILTSHREEKALYQFTDSHLTEYGAYLVYKELFDKISKRFPDAAPRALSEFSEYTQTVIGGDLAYYSGVDREVVTESATRLKANFSLKLGNYDAATTLISDYKKYEDGSARIATGELTATQRVIFRTNRENLPSALVYRDDSSVAIFDLIAERFNNVLMGTAGDFTINMTDAQRYSNKNKKTVDYIIVMVSENNIDKILG